MLGFPDRVADPQGPDASGISPEASPADGAAPDGGTVTQDAAADATGDGAVACRDPCPVMALSFNEGSGLVTYDRSGHGNHGTFMGAQWGIDTRGSVVRFDGSGQYVRVESSSTVNIRGGGFSVLFWAFVNDDQGRDQVLLGKPWTQNSIDSPYYQYGVEFDVETKNFDFYYGDDAAQVHRLSMSAQAAIGAWASVAFTFDGRGVRGFVNGTKLLDTPQTAPIAARPSWVFLGVDPVLGQGLSGALDDVRLYDQALTAAQIKAVFAAPSP